MSAGSLRNAPCPCGSGKRYKECHGVLQADAGESNLDRREPGRTERDSGDPSAHFATGNDLRRRGQFTAAIDHYQRALQRDPTHLGVLNNLGLAFQGAGQRERAERCYRDVLCIDPAHVEATGNLAKLLSEDERFAEAAVAYDRLVALRRDLPPALWLARAIAHRHTGALDQAETSFREAARLAPDQLAVHLNIGSVCYEQHRYREGEPSWLRALELDPSNLYALSMLADCRQKRCEWDGLEETFAELNRRLEIIPDGHSARSRPNPFSLLSMPTSGRAQLQAARLWAAGFAPAQPAARFALPLAPSGRLRVGFVAHTFHAHPMMHLSLEFWEKIDRSRLEMFGYSLYADDGNPYMRRAQAAFEHFTDVSKESPAQIAQRIRTDRIAILFDSNGYTEGSRERIFALRPAPLQVNCIGYPGTLGAPWYDYIFTDRFSFPERLASLYSERPLYMPHMAFPSDTTRMPADAAPTRAACGLPQRGFVFCCFNGAQKILPDVFAIWMRLLTAVPQSVLWLLDGGEEVKANLRREAGRANVEPNRLVFAPKVPVAEHLARHAAADLFIDTYPYGAHTGANDALLAGLPILTRTGDTLVTRIAGSQLQAIGLPELITETPAEYEHLALALAKQPTLLKSFRDRLAVNRTTHPLFDMNGYACDFADAMERIWREHLDSVGSNY